MPPACKAEAWKERLATSALLESTAVTAREAMVGKYNKTVQRVVDCESELLSLLCVVSNCNRRQL